MRCVASFDLNHVIYQHAINAKLVAAACANGHIRLCDLISGGSTHTLQGHKNEVLSVVWPPKNDFLLASSATDRTVRMWDIRKSNSCLSVFGNVNADIQDRALNISHNTSVSGLTFTHDGHQLVSFSSANNIRVWDTASFNRFNITFDKVGP